MPITQAAVALQQAEQAAAGSLGTARAQWVAFEAQSMRVSAVEAALSALLVRGPASVLDGTWDLAIEPGRFGPGFIGVVHGAESGLVVSER